MRGTGIIVPWCSNGYWGYGLFFGSIVIPQIWAAVWLSRGSWLARLAVVIGLFPAVGGLVALLAGIYDGYWK